MNVVKEQCTKHEDSTTVENQPKAAPGAEHLNQNLSAHPPPASPEQVNPFTARIQKKQLACFSHHVYSSPSEEQEVDWFSPRPPPLDGTQSVPLGRRQLRVPDVHDEDEAVTVGFLPNLVLEGVVKNENLPFLPLPARNSSR